MPKRSVLADIEVDRNPDITEEFLSTFFNEMGQLSKNGAAMFHSRSNSRSDTEKSIVRELAIKVWRGQSGKNINRFARITGLNRAKAERTLEEALAPIKQLEDGKQIEHDGELMLEKVRYESAAATIKILSEASIKFLVHAMQNMKDMSGSEAMRCHDIATKNAELLSGRATTRSSRMDERGKSTEQLHEEVLDGQKKLSRMNLKLVEGS